MTDIDIVKKIEEILDIKLEKSIIPFLIKIIFTFDVIK